jgi:hypothetical protein
LQRQQPGQVQQPQVPGGEFGPGLHHGRELAARLVPVVVCLFRGDVQVEDQVTVGLDERRGIRGTVLPGGFRIQHAVREPEHDLSRSPVRQVQERVEVLLHHLERVALEVTPLVLVDEPGGRDLRPGRDRPQLGALFRGEGLVEREELVVLVFTHACRFPSSATRPRRRS